MYMRGMDSCNEEIKHNISDKPSTSHKGIWRAFFRARVTIVNLSILTL